MTQVGKKHKSAQVRNIEVHKTQVRNIEDH
jgi:hypothetical protein